MSVHIPLLFTYRDRVVGMGFNALVTSHGRVLASVEGDNDIWIYGVEPGALAAHGSDPKEALEEFRQGFTNVLRDYANESHSFEHFEAAVELFFSSVNKANEAEWRTAVEAVRAGRLTIPKMRQEPAESRRFVQVVNDKPVEDSSANFAVTGSEIKSSVAA